MPTPQELNIPDKLDSILATKQAIRESIVAKGVEVPEGTTFRGYAGLISGISTGLSDDALALATATPEDVTAGKTFYAGDRALKTGTATQGVRVTKTILNTRYGSVSIPVGNATNVIVKFGYGGYSSGSVDVIGGKAVGYNSAHAKEWEYGNNYTDFAISFQGAGASTVLVFTDTGNYDYEITVYY